MHETLSSNLAQRRLSLSKIVQSYYELTKPRIILLLLITTVAGMWVAAQGQVDSRLLIVTLLGGATAAAAANTINCIYDRDIDARMERTSHRPLPAQHIQPHEALIFAALLAGFSFGILTLYANLLSALLAMAGIVFYVLIYTHWLKRHTTQNIVIGGAAGAIPPLVGWAAVTGELSWAAWLLFLIIFLWTPPHFWALALFIAEDYAEVGVPMLPVVKGEVVTVKQIWLYTLLTVPATLLLVYPLGVLGPVYGAIALGLGAVFLHKAWKLLCDPSNRDYARSLFKYSILYMMLICAGMVLDYLPISRLMANALASQVHTLLSAVPMVHLIL